MKKLSIALTAALFSVPAMAADMPVKAAYKTPVVAVYSWTGCFIGGNGGGLWVKKDWTLVTGGISVPFGDHRGNSLIVGGQVGCDYQAGNWVFGIQADYDWADTRGRHTAPLPFTGLTAYSNVRSIGSVTGRLGYAFDRSLLYVRGGWAWERDRYNIVQAPPPPTFTNPALLIIGGGASYSAAETRGGWTVGAGFEQLLTNNLSGFFEVDYYDFGTRTVTFYNDANGLPVADMSIKERKTVFKIGLNLRFGGAAAVVAKY